MNFGSNSMVWHESFSTASRVGVVATMEGWMGAEWLTRDGNRGDRVSGTSWFVLLSYCATDFV